MSKYARYEFESDDIDEVKSAYLVAKGSGIPNASVTEWEDDDVDEGDAVSLDLIGVDLSVEDALPGIERTKVTSISEWKRLCKAWKPFEIAEYEPKIVAWEDEKEVYLKVGCETVSISVLREIVEIMGAYER